MTTGRHRQAEAAEQIIALIPAHNEAVGIVAAVESLKNQTLPPTTIIVIADNCTDGTEFLALRAGALVLRTEDNHYRKAGALNQALKTCRPNVSRTDVVLVMDADSSLTETWIEDALEWMPGCGAVSGAYTAAIQHGLLPSLQHVEYTQIRRRISRSKGKVAVLSGAASMFYVGLLDDIAGKRGDVLPGLHGDFYRTDSLTEDFEITLAAKALGADPRSPSHLVVETDVMRSIKSLWGQRLRWQRGYLETLASYPLKYTWRAWAIQLAVYLMSALPLVMLAMLLAAILSGDIHLDLRWLALVPLFIGAEILEAWKGGTRARVIALLMFPMSIYTAFRNLAYWRALWLALRKKHSTWT